jgi:hypothetical protein
MTQYHKKVIVIVDAEQLADKLDILEREIRHLKKSQN